MPLYAIDGVAPELPASGRYWIAPNAIVIGRVKIEEDASIWFGTVIRGDNEPITIGRGTNIQENCVLHTDPGFPMTLGAGVTVGHMAMLHGCVVGENSLVGMGATLLNGATIAPNSLVGSNALVTEGKSFAERSLIVGAPAKAIRELDDEMVARLSRTAEHYQNNWKRFAAGLTRID
ncbi:MULTISPECIES: gamma carbonic anhydrase family protein [Azorhizobium]|uniref:Putative acetyltransferase protein n=1 Tax=Azorhizobium caulinodans (strain ATCC 43989 / DSM 5975 / JCM 20966 / LMG 6465 / NBRC 14845 / NCIMB 13405 / ORS 571) TaxID=438753 RepID=A8IMW8_AZOC5|nr:MULTISPECIES: gamma carbonic anhydrase family protein [Azorhizobium]TDU01039.1 carbonic anhydrase/acetyltransferase-like protein (isoleucine patch superfamily) [Azorhizobium sp. AG788]BAF89669.1 putative acetyltransferase protein [Azorhizobium caulinodans ORS 571]